MSVFKYISRDCVWVVPKSKVKEYMSQPWWESTWKIAGDSLEMYRFLGETYLNGSDYTNSEKNYLLALENYESLFEKDPDSYRESIASIQKGLGTTYRFTENNEKCEHFFKLAAENYEVLCKKDSDKYREDLASLYESLYFYYSDLKDFVNSERYLKLASENYNLLYEEEPDFYHDNLLLTYRNLAYIYQHLNDYANSEKYFNLCLDGYEQLYEKDPDGYRESVVNAQNSYAVLCRTLKQYEKSEKLCKAALEGYELLYKQNPQRYKGDLAWAYRNNMFLYEALNDKEQYEKYMNLALDQYTTLYATEPKYLYDLIDLRNRRVLFDSANGKIDEAMEMAKETLAMDESNDQSNFYLAHCYNLKAYEYANASDFENAYEWIDKALSFYPAANFYDSKGEFLLMQGKNQEALEMWKKVIELNPNFLDNYPNGTNLSNGLKKLGLIE